MGDPGEDRLAFGAGSLILSPTGPNLEDANAPLFGGTKLGSALAVEVYIRKVEDPILAEEHGGAEVGRVHRRWDVELRAIDLAWDEDFAAAMFPGAVTTNSPDLVPTINIPAGAASRGALASSVSLLYVAHRKASEASFILYEALPSSLGGPLAWSAYQPRMSRARFECRPDASERIFASGLLSRLSL